MKEENKKIINEINGSRAKIYYQLNQLQELTGMSIRSLKYRMKVVKDKYSNMPNLLKRDSRAWLIHYTLIDEFMPKNKKRTTTIYNHKWETMVTWNTKDSYDVNYHEQLVKEVKQELPSVNVGYVVEVDGRGINHLHALTDGSKDEVVVAVTGVLNKYLDSNHYHYQVEKINNHGSITNYLQKKGGIIIL